ncbi:DUF4112 domain-containing protein [Phormidesmis priestleyi ULC007]|uniref:DUF4112 domain-containing protein n=1 Tax=Phormidesmis priestleyi ULC007 TaxID=1920490 RepID=A0A2T1DMI7_9CYAN|nr:DUF4112 domain-containing protein [Phormidesmis priestleyi]PSB21681.1 DUF4112 domain-containing protein [Phormidesmis priestleyi ULC007]PZO50804.1 MAG: DUF4112 domain-containing protein [Phormidesmis priestleyi]
MRPDSKTASLQRLRSIAHILDNAIPIPFTPYRVGIDPIVGLIPGGGDLVMAGFSVYIVWESARLGLPRSTVTQMVSNLVFDTLAGTVPVAGDLLDVTWKANSKNIRLLEAHLDSPQHQKKANQGFVLLLLFGFLLLVVSIAALSVFVIGLVWKAIVQ